MKVFLHNILAAAGLSVALAAAAGPQDAACGNGLCGASGLSAQVLSQAALADGESTSRPAARDQPHRNQTPRDNWSRYLPARDENYNCALSFGVGGNLSKDGFLGSRVLGQTQTWRAPDQTSPVPSTPAAPPR